MAWKDSRAYSEGWEEKTRIRDRRQKLLRRVLGWGLAVAGVVTVGLLVAVIIDRRSPVLGGTPKLVAPAEMTSPTAGGNGEKTGDVPPEVSEHFPGPLVGSLRKIEVEGERNLSTLVIKYGNELKDPRLHAPLRAIFTAVLEKEFDRAYELANSFEGDARVRQALRGVILTRLLDRKNAGKAFSHAASGSQPAEFYFEYGVFLMSAERDAEAYLQFSAGARLKEGSSMLNFAAAQVAFGQENWEDVIMHVDAGEEDAESMPEVVVLWAASSEVNTDRAEHAIARCRRHLEGYPEANRVRLFLARILGSTGQLQEAVAIYQELRDSHPDTEFVLIETVRAYLLNEEAAQAVPMAAELAKQKPDDIRIQAWYADVLAAAGKSDEATAILEKFEDELKGNEMAGLNALIAMREKNYKKAAAALEPYHTMDPILGMRWATLKMEDEEPGKMTGGVQSVLANHRLNVRQWKQVAQLAAPKHWDMASFAYGKAIAAGDTTLETLNNWAFASLKNPSGFEFEEVDQVCRRALAISPKNPIVLHTLGLAMLESKQPGVCAQLLVAHAEVTEASAALSLLLGDAYRALRAFPSARESYANSLRLASAASEWPLDLSREMIEEQIANLEK